MILVKYVYVEGVTEEPIEYSCVEDFLRDMLTDEDVIELLNEIYGEVEIPAIGMMPAGDVVFRMTRGDNYTYRPDWDEVYDSVLQNEIEYVEDELATTGEVIYNGYKLTDTDFSEEG